MDSTTYLFDLLKIILPAIIVAGSIFLLFRQFLEQERQRRLVELRLSVGKEVLPLRLQAYERLTLLLERMSPSNLLVRLGSAGQSAADYQRLLQQEIRAEFEHNFAQQLYVSTDAWEQVKQAREAVLTMINRAYQTLPDPRQARGTELAKRILEGLMTDAADPTTQALLVMKQEASRLF